MNDEIDDLWLDAQLRDATSYIDDAGFSAGVLQKLPAAGSRRSFRAIILLGAALLASALAYTLSGGGSFVWDTMARASLLSPIYLFAIVFGAGLLFTGAALYTAILRSDAPVI